MNIWISESLELVDIIVNYASAVPWIYFLGIGVAIFIVDLFMEMMSL